MLNDVEMVPETANADSATAKREIVDPSNCRGAQPCIRLMHFERIGNIAMFLQKVAVPEERKLKMNAERDCRKRTSAGEQGSEAR
jgi:hypothetical protein